MPGAIAGTFLSSDARTFIEPPPAWKPGSGQGAQIFYAGSSQSLTGDLIRAGVTGVAGQVAEPFLDSSVRPDILFPAYLAGFNLAEAFYLAMPGLSWQTVVIGDPLCAPLAREGVPTTELESACRSADRAARILLRAPPRRSADQDEQRVRADAPAARPVLQSRGDIAGARAAFEQAVSLDDSLRIWRVLASIYEHDNEHDKADGVYRKLVQRDPNDALALNNLAYSLAVRHQNPQEALPMAERANLLLPRSALIYDTLGWINHLMGDHAEAARLLVTAAQSLPGNAEVQLHAAWHSRQPASPPMRPSSSTRPSRSTRQSRRRRSTSPPLPRASSQSGCRHCRAHARRTRRGHLSPRTMTLPAQAAPNRPGHAAAGQQRQRLRLGYMFGESGVRGGSAGVRGSSGVPGSRGSPVRGGAQGVSIPGPSGSGASVAGGLPGSAGPTGTDGDAGSRGAAGPPGPGAAVPANATGRTGLTVRAVMTASTSLDAARAHRWPIHPWPRRPAR